MTAEVMAEETEQWRDKKAKRGRLIKEVESLTLKVRVKRGRRRAAGSIGREK